uniref:Uncharacterized protein n=1 Tax=Rhizophora mucronata TaxID=61149 RepID=A0A2P2QVX7_RHIMU
MLVFNECYIHRAVEFLSEWRVTFVTFLIRRVLEKICIWWIWDLTCFDVGLCEQEWFTQIL